MAYTAKLITDDGLISFDFNDPLEGFCIEYAAYEPRDGVFFTGGQNTGEGVAEVIPLLALDSGDVAGASERIGQLLEMARLWQSNSVRSQAVWFEFYGVGEAPVRRLVMGGVLERQQVAGMPLNLSNDRARARLVLVLSAWQESMGADELMNVDLSLHGGLFPLPAGGTRPARINLLSLGGLIAAVDRFNVAWVGIRPLMDGDAAFISRWLATSASTIVPPAVIIGGYVVLPLNDQYRTAFSIKLLDIIASNHEQYYGDYLILANVLTSGNTDDIFGFELRWGTDVDRFNQSVNNVTYVNGATAVSSILIELGRVSIPGHNVRRSGLWDTHWQMELRIAQLAGAVPYSMPIRALILIPARHHIRLQGSVIVDIPGEVWEVSREANEDLTGVTVDINGIVADTVEMRAENWNMPAEGGKIVVAGGVLDKASGEVLSDETAEANVKLEVYKRWEAWQDG